MEPVSVPANRLRKTASMSDTVPECDQHPGEQIGGRSTLGWGGANVRSDQEAERASSRVTTPERLVVWPAGAAWEEAPHR